MNDKMTDSGIMKSVSKPNGGFDGVKIFLALIFFSIVLVSCSSLALAVYWLEFDDKPPASVNNIIMYNEAGGEIVDKIIVHQGGQIAFSVDFCKFTTAAAEIRRTWTNDLVYHPFVDDSGDHEAAPHEQDPIILPRGCGSQLVVLDVPATLPPEEYLLGNTILYKINPLKERFISYDVGPILILSE